MELMKKRKLKINTRDSETRRRILRTIEDSAGVALVDDSSDDSIVKIEYDLNSMSCQMIESIVMDLGGTLDNSFLVKLKRGFIHDFEKNELDNMRAPALPCCSDPVTILKRNGRA